MKTCTKCKESKELEDFPINLRMKTGRGSWCRKCGAASNREWQKLTGYKSKPLSREKQREYDRRPDRKLAVRNYRLKKYYNRSNEDFTNLLLEQKGNCAICNIDKPGGVNNQWAIDHDHETGTVRGILCHKCNRGLGHFDDDIDLLLQAIKYLKEAKHGKQAA